MVSGLRQAVRIVRKFCCQYSSAVAQYSTFLCLMPRWATVCFSSEADVTLDCVHTPARPDSKHRYERPRAGDEINGCCRDLLLCARPTRPSKGWWKTTATARPRTVSSSLVWRTRLVRSPNCASSFPAGGFRVKSSLHVPGDSTRRLILDHERRTEPRLIGCVFKILWPDPAEAQPDGSMATIASPSCAASGRANRIRLVSRCPRRVRWRSPPGRASAMRRSPVPPGAPGLPPRAGASPAASRRTRT